MAKNQPSSQTTSKVSDVLESVTDAVGQVAAATAIVTEAVAKDVVNKVTDAATPVVDAVTDVAETAAPIAEAVAAVVPAAAPVAEAIETVAQAAPAAVPVEKKVAATAAAVQPEASPTIQTVVADVASAASVAAMISANPAIAAGSLVLKTIASEISQYSESMGATVPQSPESAAKWQRRLHEVYQMVFRLEPTEFRVAMNLLVAAFKANHTGSFSDNYLFRGAQFLQLAKPQQQFFHHMSNLLLKAAEVGTAVAGRESDLTGIAKALPTEEARQWLSQFFR